MISILMPIYNGIEFINESVFSILTQTFNEWELLIGINGHPENSEVYKIALKFDTRRRTEIVSGLVINKEKIRVFDLNCIKGKSNTLNELIKYANYDYIALLDVDDIWEKNKLELQVKLIPEYDVIGSRCVWFGEINNIIPFIPIKDINSYDFTKVNPIINSSAIIRKSLCYWNPLLDGIEDYNLWLNLWKKNYKFYNLENILVRHRIHKNSSFNSKGNHLKVEDLLKCYS